MAEIGTVAAVFQIAEIVIKLRKLWQEIKDAPKDLSELVEDVGLKAKLLDDLRKQQQQQQRSSVDDSNIEGNEEESWERCRQAFERCIESVQSTYSDLVRMREKTQRSRTATALRIHLKKDEIQKCRDRLQTAQSTMQFALDILSYRVHAHRYERMTCDMETIMANHDKILEGIRYLTDLQRASKTSTISTTTTTRSLEGCVEKPSRTSCTDQKGKRGKNRQRWKKKKLKAVSGRDSRSTTNHVAYDGGGGGGNTQLLVYTFRIPLWTVWKCFRVLLNRSNNSFGINLRVYNMRPNDSDLFRAARQQRWEVVYQMLAKNTASVFDVDEWGQTLLHIAAGQALPKVCRFLLSNGLTACYEAGSGTGGGGKTPLKALCLAYRPITDPTPKVKSILKTARLLVTSSSEEDHETKSDFRKELRSWSHRCSLPADALSMLIPILCPSYDDKVDPLLRSNLAMSTTSPDPEFVRVCLGSDLSLKQAFQLTSTPPVSGYGHRQILFNVCRSLSRADLDDTCRTGWLRILSEIVSFETESIGTDTKLMFRSLYTAFIAFYMSAGNAKHLRGKGESWNEIMTSIGKIWLQMLVDCGADLKRYGEAEKIVLKKNPEMIILPKRRDDNKGERTMMMMHCHKVQFFIAGPEISDWSIYVVPTTHKFSRCERPNQISVYVEGHDEYEMAGGFWNLIEGGEGRDDTGGGKKAKKEEEVKFTVGRPVIVKGPIF